MKTAEETARMNARMEAIEGTLMMQSGALSSAKEQAEAHREELTRVMKDLRDAVIHQAELHKKHDNRNYNKQWVYIHNLYITYISM